MNISLFYSAADKDRAARLCVNIYMSLHVSEVKHESAQVKEAWELGQKMRNDIIYGVKS